MRPDTGGSRLGRDHGVVDLATHVGAEDTACEVEIQHTGRAEEAVIVVDLAVETHPGLHGEGGLEGYARLGDGVIGTIEGQHAAEDAAQLGGDRCEFRAITEGDGEFLGDGRLDVGDGDGLVRQTCGDGFGPSLGAADAIELDLAVCDRQLGVKAHRQRRSLRGTGRDQGAQREVRNLRRSGTDERGHGLRLSRTELLESEERFATGILTGEEREQVGL